MHCQPRHQRPHRPHRPVRQGRFAERTHAQRRSVRRIALVKTPYATVARQTQAIHLPVLYCSNSNKEPDLLLSWSKHGGHEAAVPQIFVKELARMATHTCLSILV